jgi:hypothetical protein
MPAATKLTWFAGWDLRGGGSGEARAAEVFARSQANDKGAVETYDLLAVAARGFRPPALLTVADGSPERGPWQDASVQEGPDGAALRQAWSLAYRRIAETNPRETPPYAIYLLGVNPPDGAAGQDLEVFNDFYTNVHLREVAERRHALRSVRYELVHTEKAPFKGAPRYLAVYEVDEDSASQRKHVGPPYSAGPPVWQGHRTPWRLWFRASGGDG